MMPFKSPIITLFILLSLNISAQTDHVAGAGRHIEKNRTQLGLQAADIQEMTISSAYTSKDITHIYYQQVYKGIPVFNALLNIAVTASGKMVVSGNRFTDNLEKKAGRQIPVLSAARAVEKAAEHLKLPINEAPVKIENKKTKSGPTQETLFGPSGISREAIPVSLVWQLQSTGRLVLSWNVRIYEIKSENWWEIRVNAETGMIEEQNNWVQHCLSGYSGQPDIHLPEQHGSDGIRGTLAEGDYYVFDLPVESPNHGIRSIVNSPWNKAGVENNAVTLQWHNDGVSTYAYTRGNNVWAKEDRAGDNESTIGQSASSATGDYTFPFSPGQAVQNYLDAAITNLFYWNNICHDVFYQYGFDEPSGNFQRSNLGRGGNGNDFVYADAQDGAGMNNANFAIPPDGQNPRMQLFLWSGNNTSTLVVNSPASIANIYVTGTATFNPATPASVTGNLVLSSPANGCAAFSNPGSIAGKIAVIDRGTCNFTVKVKNAQNAGAVGVILVDSQTSSTPPAMDGADASIFIVSCSVTRATGMLLKNAMLSGSVNATIQVQASGTSVIDSDFDNGVITHEYGHGVSTRLTGGPANSSCLVNAEQMGEGWSDYFTLMLCTDWSAAQSGNARGIGTYLARHEPSGQGFRAYPYSVDMSISPYTYDYLKIFPEPHFIGSVWTAMLWDMTWNIIGITPASNDIYGGNGGNNIALRLVMEALKLQPCSPGFTDGRDAILLADELLYNGRYRCAIWNAFARRGLGYSASQGSVNSATDGTEAFDVPTGVSFSLSPSESSLNQGDELVFVMKTQGECGVNNNLTLTVSLPLQLDYVNSSSGTYHSGTHRVSFLSFNLNAAQNTTHTITTQVNQRFRMPEVYFTDDAESDAGNWESVRISGSAASRFSIGTENPHSGTSAWWMPATALATQTALTLLNPVLLGPGMSLTFWHHHKLETNYDGGVVELSTNGGITWQDLGSYMTVNGYNGILHPTDNDLVGRPIFTGEQTMRKTVVDLSAFEGEMILWRFLYGSDTQNGAMPDATGWFIDDIQLVSNDTCIYVEAEISNPAVLATAFGCVPLNAVAPVITALPETNTGNGIRIFPNPARESISLKLPDSFTKGYVSIHTVTGLLIKSQPVDNSGSCTVDIHQLAAGTYFLEVNDGTRSYFERVVKQ